MPELLSQLREHLLRSGVASKYVRRYIAELSEHLADLRAEEERAGRSRADAEAAALVRLGSMAELSRALIDRRELQSWGVRAPWATFGVAPLLFLFGAYFVACLILWSAWQIFLPTADTPFGVRVDGIASLYFTAGRFLYFAAPVLVAWGTGLFAVRQRVQSLWPPAGVALIAFFGGAAEVHASRTTVTSGLGHVSMAFAFGTSGHQILDSILHSLVILAVAALPYFIWRLQIAYFPSR